MDRIHSLQPRIDINYTTPECGFSIFPREYRDSRRIRDILYIIRQKFIEKINYPRRYTFNNNFKCCNQKECEDMRLKLVHIGLMVLVIALLLGNLAVCVESTKNPQVCRGSKPDECNGHCVNLQNDRQNCGSCGNACNHDEVCQKGECIKGSNNNNNGINANNKATCTDNVKNGKETDIDCGGSTCSACADGKTCSKNTDCSSHLCTNGICQVSSEQPVTTQVGSQSNNQSATNNTKLLKLKSPGGISGVGGIKTAGYSCDGLSCDCIGDADCNDMFTNAGCGDISSCNTDANGVVTCSCLTVAFSRTNNTTLKGPKSPVGLIPVKPVNIAPQ